MSNWATLSELVGKTLTAITVDKDREEETILFVADDGVSYFMSHSPDCCESVHIEDICGDLADLVGSPILQAEESTNNDDGKPEDESFTWTFYRFATIKGSVVIRWYGTSNGYYSESVDFERVVARRPA